MAKKYTISFEVEEYALKGFVELLGKISETQGVFMSTAELENQKIQTREKEEKKPNGK